MTIVAGVRCENAVVLCADMEESDGLVKVPQEKLISYEREWCQAGFGGAGNNGDAIESIIQRLTEALDAKRYSDFSKTQVLIRGTLESIYNRTPSLGSDENKADILIAMRPKAEQEATLLKANGSILKIVQTQEVIGAGDIIRYIAHSLFRDRMPISHAVLLGTHLVSLAKKHVPGCGGPTRALIVTSDGRMGWERPEDLDRQEGFFEQFNEITKKLVLTCADTNVPNDEVDRELQTAFSKIKELRERYFDEAIQSELILSMTDSQTYHNQVYDHFELGTTFYIGGEALRIMAQRNKENRERAQQEHEAKERASAESDSTDQ